MRIIIDKHTLHKICNALNAEAAAFDVHAKNQAFPRDSQLTFKIAARDNRALVVNLLNQSDKDPEIPS